MADNQLIAVAITEIVIKRVFSRTVEAIKFDQIRLDEELQRLRSLMDEFLSFLSDSEPVGNRHHHWLVELQALAYDADNAVDELIYDIRRREVDSIPTKQQMKKEKSYQGISPSCFSASNPAFFRRKMNNKLRDINTKLEAHLEKGMDVCGILIPERGPPGENAGRISYNPDKSSCERIVGRENDVEFLVEIMTSWTNEHILLLSVEGSVGIGKTTLAQVIYDNEAIARHFDKRIWISASGKSYKTTRILKLILETMTQRPINTNDNVDNMFGQLEMLLGGKRFLLVLDNLSIDEDSDDILLNLLMDVKWTKGSWLLITARTLDLRIRSPSSVWPLVPSYSLNPLDDDSSLSIFKEYAYGCTEVQETHLDPENIVHFSRGVPLNAKLLGSMLHNMAEQEWPSIFKRLADSGISVHQVLRLCFNHLPSSSLKKCFAYCSIFPKGSCIELQQLVEFWMAEGFIEHYQENTKDLEDVGYEFFHILSQRCLLEDVKNDEYGNITHFKLHDILHDFAQSLSKCECINLEDSLGDQTTIVRHLKVPSLEEEMQTFAISKARKLSALFIKSDISDSLISDFKFLQILKLSSAKTENLPSSIGKLIHLRYLDLSGTEVKILPNSICKLYNLQTLRLFNCPLKELPKDIANLISLRHLHIFKGEEFHMPPQMGRLTSLRTLLFFNVDGGEGQRIEEIGYLKNLRGKLIIRKLELVSGKEEAEQAELSKKPLVYKLEYQWNDNREGNNNEEKVLEGLEPHPELRSLTLRNYKADKLPAWVMQMALSINGTGSSLDNMMELRLINCKRVTEIPMLGQLPFLKYLELKGLTNVTCIGLSFYGTNISGRHQIGTSFPALERLKLESMSNLTEWMEIGEMPTIEVFPCLENLTIQHCPQLTTIPVHFPSLKKLYISNPFIVQDNIPLSSICYNVTNLLELCIYGLSKLTCLPDRIFPNNPNLQIFRISSCPNLTHFGYSFQACGTSLREISINGCENLREFPEGLNNLPSLEILSIEECPNLKCSPYLIGDEPLTFLKHLKIAYCDSLTSFPCQMIKSATNLRSLRISHCPSLNSLPLSLHHMTSLSSLWISNCIKLTSVPKRIWNLSTLRELHIGCFSNSVQIDSFRECLLGLQELHVVGLYGWPQWTYLPDELQYCQGLRKLFITGFGIETLPDWLGKFSSLEELGLYSCKKLKDMPSAETMKRLTKLRRLSIFGCPVVKKRCMQYYGQASVLSTPDFELNTD